MSTATRLPDANLSVPHINELSRRVPAWVSAAALEAAVEARMLVCVVERLAARKGELEDTIAAIFVTETAGVSNGGELLRAIGAEFCMETLSECLHGVKEIAASDDPTQRTIDAAHTHARQHREEHGEPILIGSLADLYRVACVSATSSPAP